MKTLSANEAMFLINEMLTHFVHANGITIKEALSGKTIPLLSNQKCIIENVGFVDIISLYKHLPEKKKMLCLPGEIGNENTPII